jgi:Glyoxalase-like domain
MSSSPADSDRVRALRALADLTPVGWAVSVRDLDAARSRLAAAGFAPADVVPGSRARPDGTLLEWATFEIARPQVAAAPFFIRWGDRTAHPSQDSPAGCRLERLRVVTPGTEDLRRMLGPLPLDVGVEKGGPAALDITLRCPKGTVTLSGAVAASVPR